MHKILFYLIPFILFSSLVAKELPQEEFNVLAKNIHSKDNIIHASGDVVIYSSSYYLSAQRVTYDKKNETFELFDDVIVIKDNNIQTQSDYAYLNLKNGDYLQSPVFLLDTKSSLWLSSKTSNKKLQDINLEESIISSCDCVDPVWSIRVSSAKFNTKDQWLHAFNPRLYIKDVPVLYSPYFGFPTGKTRKSGLLVPTLGYSNNDGVFYAQPVFWAPKENYDFEFVPQIRNQRGYGLYNYFRFADSKDSILKIKAGVFKEKTSYKEEFDLKNSKHYGWNIDYERRNIFSKDNHQDGLYGSINWLNDIEYKTLENDEDNVSTEKKVESKINYFYNTPEYYTGFYSRYYIDTEKDSNATTLQELPQAQFHLYNKEFNKKLLYSLDSKFINYTRRSGLGANIYQLDFPISYSKYFFNDYLYLNLENRLILSKYKYKNDGTNYKDGTLVQNETSFLIGTDLIKPYDNYLHTININAEHIYPKNLREDGDLYTITNNSNDLAAFPISQESRNINLSLNQSLYTKQDVKQLINHKLSQKIIFDDNNNAQLQDLENYLKYNFNNGSITNKLVYNMQDKKIVETMADFTYNYEDINLDLGYYESKQTANSTRENLESYRIKTTYKISKDYDVSYYDNYNLLDKIRNRQGVEFNIYDKCWSLSLKYEKEIVPSTTSTSVDSVKQKVLYINLQLKPLGGVKQKYKFKDN